jgi:hypothetical protein
MEENSIELVSRRLSEDNSVIFLRENIGGKDSKIKLSVPLLAWLTWKIDKKAFKTELSDLRKTWKNRNWETISVDITLAFLSILPSLLILICDILSAKAFTQGTDYVKNVEDKNDLAVNSSDCTLIGEYSKSYYDFTGQEDNTTQKLYRYDCFEKDIVWGRITIGFIFTPGFMLIGPVLLYLMSLCKRRTLVIKTMTLLFGILVLSPILILLFPLLRVLIMIISLVNTGKEWRKFSAFIKVYEGHFESFFQCVLQFYIILTRADREPSNIQLLTVAISLIMVVVSGMNGYFRLIHLNHQINIQ